MKSPKKKIDYEALEKNDEAFNKFLTAFVKRQLRLATYKWPYGHMALKRAHIDRGLYQCEECKSSFGVKEVQKDHIEPVESAVTGFTNFDNYIRRLLVKSNGYQILCEKCHLNKTAVENEMRKKFGHKPIKVRTKKKKQLTIKNKASKIKK